MVQSGRKIDMHALGQRIRNVRKDADLTGEQVAKLIGVSKQLVSHWENGRTEITIVSLILLVEITGTTFEHLLLGAHPSRDERRPLRQVPVLRVDQMALMGRGEPVAPDDVDDWRPVHSSPSVQAFAFRVWDQAMEPANRTGDLVIIDPTLDPRPGECVVAYIPELEIVLFRRLRSSGAGPLRPPYTLIADNPSWEPVSVTGATSAVILGVKVEHTRISRD